MKQNDIKKSKTYATPGKSKKTKKVQDIAHVIIAVWVVKISSW